MNPWPGYELLWVAREKGYFAEEGVDVQLVDFIGLGDSRVALDRGLVDGIATSIIDVAALQRPAEIVWVFDASAGGDAVLGRAGLTRVQDLRGKLIALEPDSASEQVLAGALRSAGLTMDDVQVVAVSPEVGADYFQRGRVDAIATYPPVLGQLERLPGVTRLYDSAAMPGEILDVLAIDSAVLRTRRTDVQALLRAHARAFELFRRDRAQVLAMLATRTKGADLEAAYAGMKLYGPEDQAALFAPGGPVERSRADVLPLVSANTAAGPAAPPPGN